MLASMLLVAFFQGPVLINEFSYDDSGTDDREYVELYNSSSRPVDISGWKLEHEGPNGPITSYTVQANTTLAAGAFFVMGSGAVPGVNQTIGAADLFSNNNAAITLRDTAGKITDTVLYESNKGIWAAAKTKGLVKGDGVWGNFVSVDLFETSWQRIRDGFDFGNRTFHLLPWTPGKTNNRKNAVPYSQNFDSLTVDGDVPGWGGSFRLPKCIDPTQKTGENPNVIKASPQGGKAGIYWDRDGGGNANQLLSDWVRNVAIEGYVYFDAKLENTGFYESWSLGVQGTTGSFGNHPDPSKALGLNANGNTGVAVIYQVTDKAATLYLVDHNDGGWGSGATTDGKVLGSLTVTENRNDGWQRLRFEVRGNLAEVRFGGTLGCGDGAVLRGRISRPQFGGVYVGYRELIQDNNTTRPFTVDALRITVPNYGIANYGTAKATTRGTPLIASNGLPIVGYNAFAITGSGLVPSSVAVYVLGLAQANIDLGAAGGQTGSTLLVAPAVLGVVPSSATGTSSLPIPLPCDPGLIGGQLHWQILDVDPALTTSLKLGNSGGLTTTLGR